MNPLSPNRFVREFVRRRFRWFLGLALILGGGISAGFAREVRITVLHTTDLHGRLETVPTTGGGLMALGARIEQIREQEPHVLLVDCGDTIQGTPVAYQTRGRVMIDALSILRYDAWTPGNHEFDWGIDALRPLVRDAPFAVLGANIRARYGSAHPLPEIRPYIIRTLDGVRVALVGLTIPVIPLWTLPDYLGETHFERSLPALERILP
ncbi:MAG: metallophosphoesterase, partial [Kiritimatiellia bacterium]|nr:metallophosphoesterase [Kiritimatiellia bacterium]